QFTETHGGRHSTVKIYTTHGDTTQIHDHSGTSKPTNLLHINHRLLPPMYLGLPGNLRPHTLIKPMRRRQALPYDKLECRDSMFTAMAYQPFVEKLGNPPPSRGRIDRDTEKLIRRQLRQRGTSAAITQNFKDAPDTARIE
ncbi:hypothetical protein Q6D67_20920, partial [Haliea sp. E1-2-M8]